MIHARRTTRHLTPRRLAAVMTFLCVMLALTAIAGISIGSVPISPGHLFSALAGSADATGPEATIIMSIRLPRLLLAMIVGAGLSVAGLVFQALLRNPLAEPYILGISSGGTVGTLIALAFGLGTIATPAASFAGSACVMFLVYSLAQRRGQMDSNTLLMAGVMIGAFFNAVVLLIIAMTDQEMRNAFLWLMGNLSGAGTGGLAVAGPVIIAASAALLLFARSYNLIATGDETAMQLGVNVKTIRRISYLLASLITGVAVSVSGVVGFVGLIIPHLCRLVLGPDHRLLLPASFLAGGIFLALADLAARTLLAPAEIPVGAVTAAIGAPVFIALLRRS